MYVAYSRTHMHVSMCTHMDYCNTAVSQAKRGLDAQSWRQRYEINHSYVLKWCIIRWAPNGPAKHVCRATQTSHDLWL